MCLSTQFKNIAKQLLQQNLRVIINLITLFIYKK
nr:MAG TPA: hypothetical protein [Caudoviricetes sp.]